jgi:hypothetical protein
MKATAATSPIPYEAVARSRRVCAGIGDLAVARADGISAG